MLLLILVSVVVIADVAFENTKWEPFLWLAIVVLAICVTFCEVLV